MEKVEARLAALELAVEDLRAQLREAHARLDQERAQIRTMRLTHRCPSCHAGGILHFRRVPDANGSTGLVALSLTTAFSGWRGTREGDPLEVFVCRACGLLEWHAPAIDQVQPDGTNIIELTPQEPPSPTRAPYR